VTRIFLSAHQRAADCSLHVRVPQEHMGHCFSNGAPTTRWSVDCRDKRIKTGDTWVLLVSVCTIMLITTWMFGMGPVRTYDIRHITTATGRPWKYCGAAANDV